MKKLACIGFDGKQDMALGHNTKCRRSMKIVSFSENKYVDHEVSKCNQTTDVANEIMAVLKETVYRHSSSKSM